MSIGRTSVGRTSGKPLGSLWALLGLLAFTGVLCPIAKAATFDELTLRVTPIISDSLPPNPVTDLAASPTITEGQAVLTWTEPSDQPSGNVSSFIVRYATFSVDSLASNTTAWWNIATPAPNPPTPLGVGTQQSMVLDLTPGATYFFSIRSLDFFGNLSPIDTKANTPTQQAWARTKNDQTPPAPVAGYRVTNQPNGSFSVDWTLVTLNDNGTPASDLVAYVVKRSTGLRGPFTVVANLSTTTTRFDGLAVSSDEYLQIVAKDRSDNESNRFTSNLLHITPAGVEGMVSVDTDPNGTISHTYVPRSLMEEMRLGGDHLGRIRRNTDPYLNKGTGRTLATYDVDFVSPLMTVDKGITFSQPSVKVTLQYNPPADGNHIVGILWWASTRWIKVTQGELNIALRTISFNTAIPGIYQVRRYAVATELTLDKGNVFPRLFSPNGDGMNDFVYFIVENPLLAGVSGKIYDVLGAEVSEIKPATEGAPTTNSLIWDGRDKSGSIVPAGVYIYEITGEGKSITGTVVVIQ
jgi:hypothetical protein